VPVKAKIDPAVDVKTPLDQVRKSSDAAGFALALRLCVGARSPI
jgi:hypothetical protein